MASIRTAMATQPAFLAIAATLVVSYGGLSFLSYDVGRVVHAPSVPPWWGWLGPSGSALETEISEHLRRGVAALADGHGPGAERSSGYGFELGVADSLLRQAVLASPADTRAIERLAAVRWEQGVLAGSPDQTAIASLIALAATRAPRVPDVQVELGTTLYRMGRATEAESFMATAVALSPSMTNRVVQTMGDAGVAPKEILEALSSTPDVLIALRAALFSAGEGEFFLDAVEQQLKSAPDKLLIVYGEVALQMDEASRLQANLIRLGPLQATEVEAERRYQLAHAGATLGLKQEAYEDAKSAVALGPSDPRYRELLGDLALEDGRTSEAELVFREGLARLATMDGSPHWRARFYRGLGEVAERRGNGDVAFDNYKRACEQDPAEPVARQKLARLAEAIQRNDRKNP